MPDPLSADRTAEMLLWYFEEFARYQGEGRRRDAPLLDSEVVLKLALGRRVDFAATARNSAEAAVTLQEAAASCVRHLYFRPDATPYQTLGLAPGASPAAIKESFRLLMQLVHPDRQDTRGVWPEAFAAQANRAYGVLRNQDARVRYDREAEARATMARAMHRAAAAAAASKMPVVQRPRPGLGGGGLLRRRMLPEWLAAGVGDYAREHPATIAFGVLIVAAALTVVMMGLEGKQNWLTREVQEVETSSAPAILAAARDAALSVARATPSEPVVPAPVPVDASVEPNAPPVTPAVAASAAPVPNVSPANASSAFSVKPAAAPASAPVSVTRVSAPAISPVAVTAAGAPADAPAAATHAAAPASASASAIPSPASASAPVSVNSTATPAPPPRAEQVALSAAASSELPPAATEIESLFATFVESYERGRADAFAALFDDDADANLRHGRTAIRGEYDELFRLSQWRKMQLTRVNWKRVGVRMIAKGEIIVRIGWHDGREVEQRLALDMELVRRDGRVVIARLSQQPKH